MKDDMFPKQGAGRGMTALLKLGVFRGAKSWLARLNDDWW